MKAAIATIFFVLSILSGFAQTHPTKTYLIRQDDVLRIQVYGESQATAEVLVGEDGNISAPFVGIVRAEGRTTAELEADLAELYKEKLRLRDPKVSVIFAKYAPLRAWVGGAVGKAGEYEFRPGDTILNLLHQAGDPLNGVANEHRAVLRRKGMEEGIPIDLYNMLVRGDLTQNYVLEPGDVLEVPADSKNQIQILGFIQRPGQYPYREPMTLADAVALAGGEIPLRSMMSHIGIIREVPGSPGTYMMIRPNFVAFEHGDATQNIELQPHDFIFVPANNTPDVASITSIITSAFYIDSVLRNGIFGFHFFH